MDFSPRITILVLVVIWEEGTYSKEANPGTDAMEIKSITIANYTSHTSLVTGAIDNYRDFRVSANTRSQWPHYCKKLL